MREIKFRAVFKGDLEAGEPLMFYQANNENGEYDKWNLLCKFHPIVLVNEEAHIAYPLEFILADDDWIVMQYTGLRDKNGREIYEGDIVHYEAATEDSYPNPTTEYVENGVVYYDECGELCFGNFLAAYCSSVLVLGNIYENPELLETIKEAR